VPEDGWLREPSKKGYLVFWSSIYFLIVSSEICPIKERHDLGKRKWSKSLLIFIQPKIDEGLTYEDISDWLLKEYDLKVKPTTLAVLKNQNKNKIPKQPTLDYRKETITNTIIEQKQDNSLQQDDIYKRITEEVAQKQKAKEDEQYSDFRSKFIKKSDT
jgi:hypothetical protein